MLDWNAKLAGTGHRVLELTGDSAHSDEDSVGSATFIITTPEKWDSFTRFRRGAQSIISRVALLLIDEIHLLGEEKRGPTLEAVVARMMILTRSTSTRSLPISKLRILGVSATVSNLEDVGSWLGSGCIVKKFDQRYRSVPLHWFVEAHEMYQPFTFDRHLSQKLYSIIRRHSNGRPSLVFCNSRATAKAAALEIERQVGGKFPACPTPPIHDRDLERLLSKGIGFYHSGLDASDRRSVLQAFESGSLPVVCATSGLSQGVNLPAHLVVICNTTRYNVRTYDEYSVMEVLQMAGRAGRPQFDSNGTCVILTSTLQKRKYEELLSGQCLIESCMIRRMQEHLNAEIASQPAMNDLKTCLEWFRSTYMYVRIQRNPVAYKFLRGLTPAELEQQIDDMVLQQLNELANAELIDLHADGGGLLPRKLGILMARYCIHLPTIKLFRELGATSGSASILQLLANAEEFTELGRLRNTEKKALGAINKSNENVRYPIDGSRKAKCKTTASKVFLLLQLRCAGESLNEFHSLQFQLVEIGCRILRTIVEFAEESEFGYVLQEATLLHRSLSSGAGWHDLPSAIYRQIRGVGPQLATKLHDAFGSSLRAFAEYTTAEVEQVGGKASGNALSEACKIWRGAIACQVELLHETKQAHEILLRVNFVSDCVGIEHQATGRAKWALLVYDGTARLLLSRRFEQRDVHRQGGLEYRFKVPPTSSQHHLSSALLSIEHFGLDEKIKVLLPNATDSPQIVDPNTPSESTQQSQGKLSKATKSTATSKKRKHASEKKSSKAKHPAEEESLPEIKTPEEVISQLDNDCSGDTQDKQFFEDIFGDVNLVAEPDENLSGTPSNIPGSASNRVVTAKQFDHEAQQVARDSLADTQVKNVNERRQKSAPKSDYGMTRLKHRHGHVKSTNCTLLPIQPLARESHGEETMHTTEPITTKYAQSVEKGDSSKGDSSNRWSNACPEPTWQVPISALNYLSSSSSLSATNDSSVPVSKLNQYLPQQVAHQHVVPASQMHVHLAPQVNHQHSVPQLNQYSLQQVNEYSPFRVNQHMSVLGNRQPWVPQLNVYPLPREASKTIDQTSDLNAGTPLPKIHLTPGNMVKFSLQANARDHRPMAIGQKAHVREPHPFPSGTVSSSSCNSQASGTYPANQVNRVEMTHVTQGVDMIPSVGLVHCSALGSAPSDSPCHGITRGVSLSPGAEAYLSKGHSGSNSSVRSMPLKSPPMKVKKAPSTLKRQHAEMKSSPPPSMTHIQSKLKGRIRPELDVEMQLGLSDKQEQEATSSSSPADTGFACLGQCAWPSRFSGGATWPSS